VAGWGREGRAPLGHGLDRSVGDRANSGSLAKLLIDRGVWVVVTEKARGKASMHCSWENGGGGGNRINTGGGGKVVSVVRELVKEWGLKGGVRLGVCRTFLFFVFDLWVGGLLKNCGKVKA